MDINNEAIIKLLIDVGVTNAGQLDAVKSKLAQMEEQSKNTSSGMGGLATAIPDMTAKVEAFTIKTEAEYLAVVKAHEAMRMRITVMKAAGKQTAELETSLERLSAALSTERALVIAENIEEKAAAAASAAAAEAKVAETIATNANTAAHKANAAAHGMSSTAMREVVVIARELARGNFSRIPGSVSVLVQNLGMLKWILNPVVISLAGFGTAAYFVWEHFKKVNEELQKTLDTLAESDFKEHTENVRALRDVWKQGADSMAAYASAMQSIGFGDDPIKRNIEAIKARDRIEFEGRKKILETMHKIEEGQIRINDANNPAKTKKDLEASQKRYEHILHELNAGAIGRGSKYTQAEIEERKKNQDALDRATIAANQNFTAIAARKKVNDTEIDRLTKETENPPQSEIDKLPEGDPRKIMSKGQKAYEEGRRSLLEISKFRDQIRRARPDLPEYMVKHVKQMQDEAESNARKKTDPYEAAQREVEEKKKLLAQKEAQRAQTKLDYDSAEAARNAATQAGKYNAERVHELEQALPEQQAEEGLKRRIEEETFGLRYFGQAKGIADSAFQGKQTSPEQQQFLVVFEQMITGHKLTFEQAARLVELQGKNQDTVLAILQNNAAKLETVSRRLDQLSQSHNMTGN